MFTSLWSGVGLRANPFCHLVMADITKIYIWASCLEKATIELARGRCYYSRSEALKHRHAVDNFLFTFAVSKEYIA